MDQTIFLNQTFHLYKANDAPKLEFKDEILKDYTEFLYKYLSQTKNSILHSGMFTYNQAEFSKQFTLKAEVFKEEELEITWLNIKSKIHPHQVIIYVRNVNSTTEDFKTIVFVRTPNTSLANALLKILESTHQKEQLQSSQENRNSLQIEAGPLVCTPLAVSAEFIQSVFTQVCPLSSIGSVELTFSTSDHIKNESSLKSLSFSVSEKDIKSLGGTCKDLYSHIQKITSINLFNLSLNKFTSELINLSHDGKIKIFSSSSDYKLVKLILNSLIAT